jgi:hypothetical protein
MQPQADSNPGAPHPRDRTPPLCCGVEEAQRRAVTTKLHGLNEFVYDVVCGIFAMAKGGGSGHRAGKARDDAFF